MSKARNRALVVVLALLLAGAGLVWLVRGKSAAPGPGPVQASAVDALPRAGVVGPSATSGHGPAPRWSAPRGDEPQDPAAGTPTRMETTLRNGIHGVLIAKKARVPLGRQIDLTLDLTGPDGRPLGGRGDIELLLLRDGDGARSRKLDIVENVNQPGNYMMFGQKLGDEPGSYQAIATFTESGNPNEPGQMGSLVVMVDYGEPVMLNGTPRVSWVPGLDVAIPVKATQAAHVLVRAELRDASGNALAEATGEADVAAGSGEVTLDFGAVMASKDDPRAQGLTLHDVTLFRSDGQGGTAWADYWEGARQLAP